MTSLTGGVSEFEEEERLHLMGGRGAYPLHPPPRSAPAYFFLTALTHHESKISGGSIVLQFEF